MVQVLVFVHARNATGKLAATMKEMASVRGHTELFLPDQSGSYLAAQKSVSTPYRTGPLGKSWATKASNKLYE